MAAGKKPVLRKCVGCGEMKDRRDMVRVVRDTDGNICIDITQKMNGRGAYVCKSRSCLDTAIKRRGLERTLKCAVPKDICTQLQDQIEGVL